MVPISKSRGIREYQKNQGRDPDPGYSMHNTASEKPFPKTPLCRYAKATVLPKSSSDSREEGPASLLPSPQPQMT